MFDINILIAIGVTAILVVLSDLIPSYTYRDRTIIGYFRDDKLKR